MNRRAFLSLTASAGLVSAGTRLTLALDYPTRPVRLIVNLAPGGGLDFMSRVIGQYLSRALGQQVIVENRPGAGGMLAVETVAKSPADGYTLLATTDVVASAPYTMSINVDYVNALVPVIELIHFPQVLAVHPSLGVGTVAELIAAAKRTPGMGYATSGAGTQQHFIGEWFAQIAGIKLEHVPYRGAGQAINDLVAGHVLIASLGPTALIPHHNAGAIRIIAQSAQARSPSLPDVPTFEEAGVKGLVLDVWQGVFAPPGTPEGVVARLNAEMNKALLDEAVRERLLEAAQEPVGGPPERLAKIMQEERKGIEDQLRQAQKMEAVGNLTGGVAHAPLSDAKILEHKLSFARVQWRTATKGR